MFIAREKELQSLEAVYVKNGFGMTIIYGRRRVGKSTLIREFVSDKKYVFYTATKVGAVRNLELFTRQVLEVIEPNMSEATFPTIEDVFNVITDYLRKSDDNIERLFFSPDGYLFDETKNLLTQVFADVTLVNNIIEQVAKGDHMFKFWYRFIANAISVIEMGQGRQYYDKVVKPRLHLYMGSVFEEMCRYYTLEQGIAGAYGSIITSVGTWWGVEHSVREVG